MNPCDDPPTIFTYKDLVNQASKTIKQPEIVCGPCEESLTRKNVSCRTCQSVAKKIHTLYSTSAENSLKNVMETNKEDYAKKCKVRKQTLAQIASKIEAKDKNIETNNKIIQENSKKLRMKTDLIRALQKRIVSLDLDLTDTSAKVPNDRFILQYGDIVFLDIDLRTYLWLIIFVNITLTVFIVFYVYLIAVSYIGT